jgi:hypothetical protein
VDCADCVGVRAEGAPGGSSRKHQAALGGLSQWAAAADSTPSPYKRVAVLVPQPPVICRGAASRGMRRDGFGKVGGDTTWGTTT